ncbi:hypothetical protein [Azospirillum picis]|uniref:Lipoprotein n=1 Tax=Azospirillum picis TaxID=488438 RepID=A0ABU0MSL5_9PROT|nr:hypothetical protein [Azospirillum picis]MBP2302701.1 hypothetical protein [Azospirillum picis]MDQ0536452.1 hypothetical protein [Azospirillum picis]
MVKPARFPMLRAAMVMSVAGALNGCSLLGNASSTGTLNVDGRSISYDSPQALGGPVTGEIARLFTGRCIYKPKDSGAAIAALAPALLDFAVDSLGKILTRAGAERAVAVYAARAYAPPTARSDPAPADAGGRLVPEEKPPQSAATEQKGLPECVQFVLARFAPGPETASIGAASPMLADTLGETPDVLSGEFGSRGIFLAERPVLFLEAKLITSPDGKVYRLRPTILQYEAGLDTRQVGGERGLFVEFGINSAPNSLASDKASRGTLPIGIVVPGQTSLVFRGPDPRMPEMLWTASPSATTAAPSILNIEMRIVEVRNGRPVLAALGTLLSGKQGDDIAAALRRDLFPTEEERRTALTARLTGLEAYRKALAAYRQAIDDREQAKAASATKSVVVQNAIQAQQNAIVESAILSVRLAAAQAGVTPPDLAP